MATAIGTLGTIPTMVVSGRLFTDLTSLIVLAGVQTTASKFGTFKRPNTSAGYQVTAGKTLTISAAAIIGQAAAANYDLTLLYGDTDVGYNSASAPTNVFYFANSQSTSVVYSSNANATGASNFLSIPFLFTVAATKYPGYYTTSGPLTPLAYGYET